MDNNKMTPLQKVEAINNVLDKLTDSSGRMKCGYIWCITELLNGLQSDILVMEEQIKDLKNSGEETSEKVETMSQE